jgi:hypothetical protein
MHNSLRAMPKAALKVLASGLFMTSAMVAGCDSSQDPNTTEAKAQIQASRENQQKEDDKTNAQLQKSKAGKGAPPVHNIKGGLKAPAE